MTSNPLGQFESSFDAAPADDEEGLDLRRYLGAILRYKWALLGLALAVGAATWLYASTLTPYYRAVSTLMLELNAPNIVSIEQVYNSRGESVRTQLEIMRSRDVAQSVVDRLKLDQDPAFLAPDPPGLFSLARWLPSAGSSNSLSPEQAKERAIGRVQSGAGANLVDGTTLVRISFEARDRDRAVAIANAIGDAYIENGLDARVQSTEQASSWLNDRLDALQVSLRQSEQRLQQYREAHGLAEASAATGDDRVVSVASGDLEKLRGDAQKQDLKIQQLQSTLSLLQTTPRDRWTSQPALATNEALQDLLAARAAAERKVGELSQRYGPKHPKMIEARGRLTEVERSLDERANAVVANLQDQLTEARDLRSRMSKEIDEARNRVQSIQRRQFELTKLQRDVEADQRLYDLFLDRIKETRQASFAEPVARVVERARNAFGPVRPNKSRLLLMAILGALMLGVGLVVLRELLDNTFKATEDLMDGTGLPVLGVLPLVPEAVREGERVPVRVTENEQGGFAEAVRTLRTAVILSGLDAPQKIIVVTSAVPGEGKTTVSTNLALALGRLERVLLIDADMRRPSIARDFDLPASAGGVSSIIAGDTKPDKCIQRLADNVDVLAAGIIPPNPLELISSRRFKALLDALANRYDRIIIDTAPVHAVSDALVMATLCDAMVFVVKADSTPRPVVQASLRRLRQVNAPIIGAVLNRLDVGRGARYGYSDYYGYYSEYRYESESSSDRT